MSLYKPIQPLLSGFTTVPAGSIVIYKITSKSTGQFYIGQTEDVKRRLYRHFVSIKYALLGKQYRILPFHISMAEAAAGGRKAVSLTEAHDMVLRSISFEVLAVLSSKADANKFEYELIERLRSNKLCLNRRFS